MGPPPLAGRFLIGIARMAAAAAVIAWQGAALARGAERPVGGPEAGLVIDHTALPKESALSVGVARRCRGRPGTRACRQALVPPTLARGQAPVLVALRPRLCLCLREG